MAESKTDTGQDWRLAISDKLISSTDAAALVRDGQWVGGLSGGWGTSESLLRNALMAREGDLHDVRISEMFTLEKANWYAKRSASFDVEIGYATKASRPALDQHWIDWAPPMLGYYPRVAERGRNNQFAFDFYFTRVSPPDANGFCSFGASGGGSAKFAIKHSRVVIAELSHDAVRCYGGDNLIHMSEIDYFCDPVDEVGHIPPGLPLRLVQGQESEAADVIGAHASTLIRDGDCIQIGAGIASAALYDHLFSKSDLGFHSEIIEENIIGLVDAGVVNGRRKTINTGKVVASGYRGSPEFLQKINMNPMYEAYGTEYVDSIRVISQLDNFVAVNSALMMDLTGQSTAESIGTRTFTGPGGQTELVIGASMSTGGMSITCLPATAQEGKVSRILPTLPEGTAVTVPRAYTDMVVSEYGIASLMGRTLRERARELIAIAAPQFRDELSAAAKKLFG